MLSAFIPVSIPLNRQRTVIIANVGATVEGPERASGDKGDGRDSGCHSMSKKLFIKPTPPPLTLQHTDSTYHHADVQVTLQN